MLSTHMKWIIDIFRTSVGKKFIVAFTGLFLIAFLLVHLYGNLLLLNNDGGASFNAYGEALLSSVLMRAIEVLLFMGLFVHIGLTIKVSIENKKARPEGYAMQKAARGSTWFSRNMRHTGSIILIFLVLHLKSYFWDHRIMEGSGTMYDAVVYEFSNIYWVLFYVASMGLLSFHLVHGVQSTFQSLGLRHEKYTIFIKIAGYVYALAVPFTFAIIPIIIYNG
ncbi:MAG: succinate dehydrogenase cytochrome b subunit [Leptospirales bacterium]